MPVLPRTLVAVAALSLAAPAARSQGARAPAANPWSLGMDASVRSVRGFARGQRGTISALPDSVVRIGYRVAPMLQLEVPFHLGASWVRGLAVQQLIAGLDANLFFAPHGTVRPFVGGGPSIAYTHYRSDFAFRAGEQVTESDHFAQVGLSGRAGLEWQLFPSLSLRPALVYEHEFENRGRDLAGYDAIGVSLGSTLYFGPQPDARSRRLPFRLGFGGELSRMRVPEASGADGPRTLLDVPRAIVGLLVPVDSTGQTLAGANLAVARIDVRGRAYTDLTLQPRVELDLRPDYRDRPGVRIGLEGDVRYQRSASDQAVASRTQFGGGADVSLTVPLNRSLLYHVGLGYDYFLKRPSASLPAQRRLSLRFGVDAI
jgi:hypothetical protein